ncbi:glycosyltransferase family 2 protein [candidate division KSB1 bacterium]|nr:glycosyltransferase family 2 protein [candidate division KSB1 bacterium]
MSYNTADLLIGCLRSLARVESEAEFEIIVVDNSSQDGSAARARSEFPGVKVVQLESNLGFAAGVNRGLAVACAPLVFAVNPDCIVPRETLRRLLSFMADHPRAAIAGAGLTTVRGQELASTFRFPSLFREFWNLLPELKSLLKAIRIGPAGMLQRRAGVIPPPQRAESVSGAALIMRAVALREAAGFDEGFFLYHEEIDLCTRLLRAGWEVWCVPAAQVIHFDAQASGYRSNRLAGDPVLTWRLMGMDRLWSKHRPGLPHRLWKWQTRWLLLARVWFVRLLGPLGRSDRNARDHRISELFTVRQLLGRRGRGKTP